MSHARLCTRVEGVLVKPRIGPGSLVDRATPLNDTFITIEIWYLDSSSNYREALQSRTAVEANSSFGRRYAGEFKKKGKRYFALWSLVGITLLVAALTWILR